MDLVKTLKRLTGIENAETSYLIDGESITPSRRIRVLVSDHEYPFPFFGKGPGQLYFSIDYHGVPSFSGLGSAEKFDIQGDKVNPEIIKHVQKELGLIQQ